MEGWNMPSGQEPCPAETWAEVREGGAGTVNEAVAVTFRLMSSYKSGDCVKDFALLDHFKSLPWLSLERAL